MGLSKLFLFLGVGVLAVCLVLSITTLQVLRNAISENDLIQENAYSLVGELNGCVRALGELSTPTVPAKTEQDEPAKEVVASVERYWLRASGDKIGLYNAEGKLLKLVEIPLTSLPASMREELSRGVSLSSLEELFELLRDLEP